MENLGILFASDIYNLGKLMKNFSLKNLTFIQDILSFHLHFLDFIRFSLLRKKN